MYLYIVYNKFINMYSSTHNNYINDGWSDSYDSWYESYKLF